jgi:hypothetical protein
VRKLSLVVAGIAALAIAVPAAAVTVYDPTPNGAFSDGTNQGYVQVDTDGHAIRACNENPNQPGGDDLTGYVWVSQNGESTTPSYGNANVGAGDADGEDDGDPTNGTESHDCPTPAS